MIEPFNDEFFMNEALKEANKALYLDEVPVGAVIVLGNKIISRAHNYVQTLKDTTAHAEMQAITMASASLGGKYLNECIMYVTLEPCVMCTGAIFWSKIPQLVFGAKDKKNGFLSVSSRILNKKTQVRGGVMEYECKKILLDFFAKKR